MPAENENLKVAVRVRPLNEREKKRKAKCIISMKEKSTAITNPATGDVRQFTFDYSYWSHDGYVELDDGRLQAENPDSKYADQTTVYNDLGDGVLQNAWAGYNATLFAYGQTGSGKSYSMIGNGNNKGIVPITCGQLFQSIGKVDPRKKEIQIMFSMLEIYNEQIRDLLQSKSEGRSLKVRENNKSGFYVEDLSWHPCRDYKSIEKLMEIGTINRTTASTNMNATSSRSHMVISIKFKQVFKNAHGQSTTKTSEINLVDLAGSERADSTGATGDRLKEGSAINKSLLMLGTVIEKLASGNQHTLIPYRDSVLTKLLKSALGGNSKTIMIAALSPADINYEETLSTLRYADRAKKIKNRAVVNESPTDRLIRELKSENAKLLARLKSSSHSNSIYDSDEVKRLIAQNEQQLKEISMSWEQKLEAARKQWENEQKLMEKKDKMLKLNHPFLQNVNEDPQLSGIIKHPIHDGTTTLGRTNSKAHNIVVRGLGILEKHCELFCSEKSKEVKIGPCQRAELTVNGLPIFVQTTLKHGDRIKLGSNVLFLYFGFPNDNGSVQENMELQRRYDYEYFQNELLSATGISQNIGELQPGKNKQLDTNPVYIEYIELMPVVSCLNAMSLEMEKHVEFSLLVKNLATCDEYGQEMRKEVMVQVSNQVTNQMWIWSKSKFTNRRYMIEELFMKHQDSHKVLNDLPKEADPFWDPVEDIYLGRAHIWLHSLAYCIACNDHVTFNNHSGGEEGLVNLSIAACSPNGQIMSDELIVIDSNNLLGKRFDLVIHIEGCHDVRWIKENTGRGIVLKYKFYNEANEYRSAEKWHSANPSMSWKERITVDLVDSAFLQYLHSAALVVEMWGLQDGRTETLSSRQDSGFFSKHSNTSPSSSTPSTSSESAVNIEALENELMKSKFRLKSLEEDNKDLRKLCQSLKKDNAKLKKKVQMSPRSAVVAAYTKHRESPVEEKLASSNRVQAELGRALKSFFSDIKYIQSDLRKVADASNETESDQVLEITENLDHVLSSLKGKVTTAVRNHKTEKKSLAGINPNR